MQGLPYSQHSQSLWTGMAVVGDDASGGAGASAWVGCCSGGARVLVELEEFQLAMWLWQWPW